MPAAVPHFDTLADVVRTLGDIPLDRILWNPFPGTATEEDQLRYLERDGRLVELIDGILVEKPMGAREGFVSMTLALIVGAFVRERQLGIVGGEAIPMRVTATRNRMPDVSFTSWKRLKKTNFRAVLPMTPDLAVEVLSPSNTRGEIAEKIREYFAGGTKLVWVFDPVDQGVAVYTSPKRSKSLGLADSLTGGSVLPGFTLDLSAFWNDPQVTLTEPKENSDGIA